MERLKDKQAGIVDFLRSTQFHGQTSPIVVEQVMTVNPICVEAGSTVLSLVELFHSKGFRHLLVTDSRRHLLGVVSDRDVGRCFRPNGRPDMAALTTLTAGEIMSVDLITTNPQRPVSHAIDLMVEQGVNCLPVIDGGRLVGILTSTDFYAILQAILEALPALRTEESFLPDLA
jgi:acetoin utilization protein AcuB